jgi:hypothetical protein
MSNDERRLQNVEVEIIELNYSPRLPAVAGVSQY